METIRVHCEDLPDLSHYDCVDAIAIDTETLGLNLQRDRLCVVQLSPGDGTADIIRIKKNQKPPIHLLNLLKNNSIVKIFHYARFDLAMLMREFGFMPEPVFCTKIASKLTRTYTERHGLKELCSELLGIHLSKQQQSSDWGAATLTSLQLEYAAADVLYLHQLRKILQERLLREDRAFIAEACFKFLSTRVELDLAGWENVDLFAHH